MIHEAMRGFKEGMHNFTSCITILVNSALLSIVYVIGIGIPAIIAKLSGKKFMETDTSKATTYWTELNIKKKPLENYYRQF